VTHRAEPQQPDPACPICGVPLHEQHTPLARALSWPPACLPGDLPTRDELCDECAHQAHNRVAAIDAETRAADRRARHHQSPGHHGRHRKGENTP
jgi:hypothetical protein